MQWFLDNKEWFFSGAGVVLITVVADLFMKNEGTKRQVQKSGCNSTNYQAGRDIKLGNHNDK